MRARLKNRSERGHARGLTGSLQSLRLGAGTAARLRPAAANNDTVLDHDRADGGIGPGAALPAPSERQRQRHKALIGGFRLLRLLRELVFQNAEQKHALRGLPWPFNSVHKMQGNPLFHWASAIRRLSYS